MHGPIWNDDSVGVTGEPHKRVHPDDHMAKTYDLEDNTDFKQLRGTVEANPHLGVTVSRLTRLLPLNRGVSNNLAILNRAQFFEPEKFHAYAEQAGAEAKEPDRFRPSRSLRKKAASMTDNYPAGDLREHAERLGLVGTPNPDNVRLDRSHLGRGKF